MIDSDTLKGWARRARVLAKDLRRQSEDQHSCCHGDDASDALYAAAIEVNKLADAIEQHELDLFRKTLT